jgi:hypothetical protein
MLFIAWLYETVFNCCRRVDRFLFKQPEPEERENIVSVSKLPWLWIGALYPNAETTIDCTYLVDLNVTYGMTVTTEWLENITGYTPLTWKYLDAKSLEEKEFPSSGFVIDDTKPEELEKSSIGTNANPDHTE